MTSPGPASEAPRETSSETPPLAAALGMQPHPEGGWFVETWAAPHALRPDGYPGPRAAATAIYFLLTPDDTSAWHTVRSDELWLWHRGGPLELLLGGDGDAPSPEPTVVRLGPAVENGERPQVLVPGGVWQSARPATRQEILVSCLVSPGFDYADFRMLDRPGPAPH
ncbi:cupin domain-containing protein [Streptomyces sp. NPDC058467]|uniref:cupin domain-containing protein n=1 Tax=Streptomyces sp. NPDC058467 TaxID=3346513 RepID=UPI00366429DF